MSSQWKSLFTYIYTHTMAENDSFENENKWTKIHLNLIQVFCLWLLICQCERDRAEEKDCRQFAREKYVLKTNVNISKNRFELDGIFSFLGLFSLTLPFHLSHHLFLFCFYSFSMNLYSYYSSMWNVRCMCVCEPWFVRTYNRVRCIFNDENRLLYSFSIFETIQCKKNKQLSWPNTNGNSKNW